MACRKSLSMCSNSSLFNLGDSSMSPLPSSVLQTCIFIWSHLSIPVMMKWELSRRFASKLLQHVQEVAINDQFAKMTEALYVAEQSARQAVEMRSKVQREIAAKETEKKDRELRELAVKARAERIGGGAAAPPSLAARDAASTLPPPPPSSSKRYEEVWNARPALKSISSIIRLNRIGSLELKSMIWVELNWVAWVEINDLSWIELGGLSWNEWFGLNKPHVQRLLVILPVLLPRIFTYIKAVFLFALDFVESYSIIHTPAFQKIIGLESLGRSKEKKVTDTVSAWAAEIQSCMPAYFGKDKQHLGHSQGPARLALVNLGTWFWQEWIRPEAWIEQVQKWGEGTQKWIVVLQCHQYRKCRLMTHRHPHHQPRNPRGKGRRDCAVRRSEKKGQRSENVSVDWRPRMLMASNAARPHVIGIAMLVRKWHLAR